MKKGQKLWTRDELILAINLYCKLPFGKLHSNNPEVINLAKLIGRTPGSVAYKLVNFASLDPSLRERGIKGAYNVSNLDKKIWVEFYNNWNVLPYESEKLLAKFEQKTVENYKGVEGFCKNAIPVLENASQSYAWIQNLKKDYTEFIDETLAVERFYNSIVDECNSPYEPVRNNLPN